MRRPNTCATRAVSVHMAAKRTRDRRNPHDTARSEAAPRMRDAVVLRLGSHFERGAPTLFR